MRMQNKGWLEIGYSPQLMYMRWRVDVGPLVDKLDGMD